MLTTLFSELDELRQRGISHFIVGFSGGLDSTALLYGCTRYCQQHPHISLSACHIHHGLSANADAWVEHCQTICQQLNVRFASECVEVTIKSRQSLEGVAREARYRALSSYLVDDSYALLTGHHQGDQVETLFLSLKRGSGLDGLSGMPPVMRLGRGWLARPLLPLSRQQLADYGQQQGLSWIDDESNDDQSFDRNFIRHQLIPATQQRWPSFVTTAARSVSLLAQDRAILEEVTAADFQRCREQAYLRISELASLSAPRRDRVLRHWLRQHGAPLWSHAQMQQAWQGVACAKQDAEPKLCWGDWQLRRYRNQLVLCHNLAEQTLESKRWHWPEAIEIEGLGQLISLPSQGQQAIRQPLASEQVSVRFGQLKLRVRPADRAGSRELKKVWQERGVPPWLRGRIPLIFFNEECVAAVGFWLAKDFVCQPNELGWLVELR